MKICTKCEKESNNFSLKSSWCRLCKKEAEQERRAAKGISPKKFRKEKNGLLECLECLNYLPPDAFNKSSRGSFGRSSYCKNCQKTKQYPSKAKNKFAVRKYRQKGVYKAAHRLREFNRKSLIKAVSDGTVTKAFIVSLLETLDCIYCKNFTKPTDRTLDHVVALNKGGLHSSQNMVMACVSCNSKKRDLDLEEFLEKYDLSM